MASESVAPSGQVLEHMQRGHAPPAFLGMVVNLGELPFVQLVASDPSTEAQLREWLRRPSTRRAIVDALFDELERLG